MNTLKKYTEEDLRAAFKAGRIKGEYPSFLQGELDEDEWIKEYTTETEKAEKEKTVPVTLATIKAKCGWTLFCDVTGSNHYMLKEFTVDDREIFDVKETHTLKLGLI